MTRTPTTIENRSTLPSPYGAMASLLTRLSPVATRRVPLVAASGRVLAQPVVTDRPSPPCDVSAMDGYALRMDGLTKGRVSVAGEVATGHAPPALPPDQAVRVFTGGAVPAEAQVVIRREDVSERTDAIDLPEGLDTGPGANIRYCGENAPVGAAVVEAGTLVTPAVAAALATFGVAEPKVFNRVRISVLVTGDELVPVDATPQPWQIRDSNSQTLATLLGEVPWIELLSIRHVHDQLDPLTDALRAALDASDAVLLTGGVSMGDYDFVPDAVGAAGGTIAFHKLAMRPGKPLLGGVGPNGQAILGLPGNPVSVMVTARRWASVALRKRAGLAQPDPPTAMVRLVNPMDKRLSLWCYRPVRLTETGQAELIKTMGSGDLAATATSDGFVELPPDTSGSGPWPFYPWSWT